ncbi:MAG: NAD(P)/FAD-dependent oxidoreductase [Rubripirellula sp.]
MKTSFDVAIIGAGFAGSILAWILSRSGMSVALIDAATHPRFAIGESSTPIADMILRRLSQVHGIAELNRLATWGDWQQSYPNLACGRKRGFSYYQHAIDRPFSETQLGSHSLLIAASPNDDVSDTHWYRPDVDHFLFQHAISSGVADYSGHRVTSYYTPDESTSHRFVINTEGAQGVRQLAGHWLIDASGAAAVTTRLASTKTFTDSLKTSTRATYAHYRNVGSWTEQLDRQEISVDMDPFNADDAAQHHLLESGWLWMLRFNNGITSIGLTSPFDQPRGPADSFGDYPSLRAIMQNASVVAPADGPRTTQRLQYLVDPLQNPRHLLLPTAALTLDPLHSTGIAHGLAGVDRIASILLTDSKIERDAAIDSYRRAFFDETRLLDLLVSTAYATMRDFDRFAAACSIFIAGAICSEERYQQGNAPSHLWNADDPQFMEFATQACLRLRNPKSDFESFVRNGLTPWNHAGLMDPAAANRYAFTATKR